MSNIISNDKIKMMKLNKGPGIQIHTICPLNELIQLALFSLPAII